MNGFVLHPDALTDLNEIWEYIAADNPGAADRVLEDIHEAIRALVSFPQLGHQRADLTSRPLRFHPVRNFLIAFRMSNLSSSWPCFTAAATLG
jgi:plasmid stabilization system protein ParE